MFISFLLLLLLSDLKLLQITLCVSRVTLSVLSSDSHLDLILKKKGKGKKKKKKYSGKGGCGTHFFPVDFSFFFALSRSRQVFRPTAAAGALFCLVQNVRRSKRRDNSPVLCHGGGGGLSSEKTYSSPSQI